MKSLLTLALILTLTATSFHAASQAATQMSYLDKSFHSTVDTSAVYVRTIELIQDDIFAGTVTTLNGELKMKGEYVLNGQELIENGLFTFYFSNGKIESEGIYDMGLKSGSWKRFTKDGSRRSDRYYPPAAHKTIRSAMEGSKP